MDVLQMSEMKKVFMPSKERYKTPHVEALKLRILWTYEKKSNRVKDTQEVKNLYENANKYAENDVDYLKAFPIIKKGLKLDPRFHSFYAIRGDVYFRKGMWNKAVLSYEQARRMVRFDKKIPESKTKTLYNRRLIDAYWKRGNWYDQNGLLLESMSDFEQILVLKSWGSLAIDVQNKLLTALRALDKYEGFRFSWAEFIRDADPLRTSDLLTRHAEYKIHLREMAGAHHILSKAIDLDAGNTRAQELLQVVFDTGHTMVVYAVIWCIHGCYDKALMAIDKGMDCDPYNPGYTLLKTIILRLSGRLMDAARWLESVDKGFHKLLQPSRDKQGSIMGNLTIEQTRLQLIKQYYLIRYDLAVACMIEGRYKDTIKLLNNSKLRELHAETSLLLGDCMLKLKKPKIALQLYSKCREKQQELHSWRDSMKKVHLARRLAHILNCQARLDVQNKRSRAALNTTEKLLRVFDNDDIELSQLGTQRAEAFMYLSRGYYQLSSLSSNCPVALADSLCFARGIEDGGLYGVVFGEDAHLENVIDHFASEKKLPQRLKLLMQYS